MHPDNQAVQVALAAAKQLPPKLRKELTERLIMTTITEENVVLVYLRRLSPQKQARLAKLMDKSSEGQLARTESLELKRLGTEVDEMLLTNSQMLARALRPELFDKRARPVKRRLRQALNDRAAKHQEPKTLTNRTRLI